MVLYREKGLSAITHSGVVYDCWRIEIILVGLIKDDFDRSALLDGNASRPYGELYNLMVLHVLQNY